MMILHVEMRRENTRALGLTPHVNKELIGCEIYRIVPSQEKSLWEQSQR